MNQFFISQWFDICLNQCRRTYLLGLAVVIHQRLTMLTNRKKRETICSHLNRNLHLNLESLEHNLKRLVKVVLHSLFFTLISQIRTKWKQLAEIILETFTHVRVSKLNLKCFLNCEESLKRLCSLFLCWASLSCQILTLRRRTAPKNNSSASIHRLPYRFRIINNCSTKWRRIVVDFYRREAAR